MKDVMNIINEIKRKINYKLTFTFSSRGQEQQGGLTSCSLYDKIRIY